MLAGFAEFESRKLVSALDGVAEVAVAPDAATAGELLARRQVAVLCLGDGTSPADARRLLEQPAAGTGRRNIVLGAGDERAGFQPFVDRDELYFLSSAAPATDDVEALLRGALTAGRRPAAAASDRPRAAFSKRDILTVAHQLAAESDPGRVAVLTAQAIETFVEADRAYCLVFDPLSDTLWTRALGSTGTRRESASAGVVSFVLRTGREVRLERLGTDPRYDPEADHDGGSPEERFVALPAVAPEDAGSHEAPRTQAVLVAVREPSRPPFSDAEVDLLRLLALQVAPVFARFALRTRLELDPAGAQPSAAGGTVFRREALDAYVEEMAETGNLLRISPTWLGRSYWLLALLLVAGVAFATLGSVSEWAAGAAVVRLGDRLQVTAAVAGTVREVAAAPGREVAAGEPLVRLDDDEQRADLERLRQAFDLLLVERLRDPAGRAGQSELASLREQRRLAAAALARRSLRAPRAGVVGEVRVREGQHVAPGEVVATIAGPGPAGASPAVVAALPGRHGAHLRAGMELLFEPQGQKGADVRLVIREVGDGVVGPAEARRVLGSQIGDALTIDGPVILVRARLPDGAATPALFREGTVGRAEVRVRSEPIMTALFPGLRGVTRGGG